MTLQNLSDLAKQSAPMVANHLWQSTLFAIVAGLLTLALRKDQARVRYVLWLAASVKFLLPFSLLVALGAHMAVPHVAGVKTSAYIIVEQASQPFAQPTAFVLHTSLLSALLPVALSLVWLCGFVAVLSRWVMRWRRISLATQTASPLCDGREVETLRTLERAAGLSGPIPFLLSQGSMEPGIFGIARPILLWPVGISQHLHDAHLKAILAHEVCHVRRRDNLAAAVHLCVEALFWFYPLVWWIGARLIDERERACDEAVLEIGTGPEVYAESILKACEFCVESPLSCVSGVTGSNLKKRIVRIMTQPRTNQLTRARKLLLATAGIAAIAAPVTVGIVGPRTLSAQSLPRTGGPLPPVEVISLRQSSSDEDKTSFNFSSGRVTATNVTVKALIKLAYSLNDTQLSGGPAWIGSTRYDIDIKAKDVPADGETGQMGESDHPLLLLQSFLTDQFHLALRQETRDQPVYALVIADGGPKLTEVPIETVRSRSLPQGPERSETRIAISTNASPSPDEQIIHMQTKIIDGSGSILIIGPLSAFADALSSPLKRQVIDKTGLNGNYSMMVHWVPGEGQMESISAALQDKYGLLLTPEQAPVTINVIDQVELPSTK